VNRWLDRYEAALETVGTLVFGAIMIVVNARRFLHRYDKLSLTDHLPDWLGDPL